MGKSSTKAALGIVGSPRREGNTEILVDEILSGAKEANALTEKIILNELEIAPCHACFACQKKGKCVQQDDLPKVIEKMEKSHLWVLGTPIYWWGPTAQLKAFVDRWISIKREVFQGRCIILAMPLGGGHPDGARHAVGMLTSSIRYLGMEVSETVIAPGVESLGDVRNHGDVLAKAHHAGQKAIELLRI
ncbi:MAG: flavodoxin family protein [Candidatus Hodarchaeota archaeon]